MAVARINLGRAVSRKKALSRFLQYFVCGLVSLIIVIPLLSAVLAGFKTTAELTLTPFDWPKTFHWENYTNILTGTSFWGQMLNSVITMLGTVGIVLVASSMTAFVFARLVFPGRELIFNFFTIGLFFPLTVAILPLYISLRDLHLLDNLLGIILPQVAFGLPYNIVILRGFFRSVPGELEDAAYIDGCTIIGFFWRILLPLSRPALATVAMLTIVSSWNNFLLPLVVLNKPELATLPLGVMQFQGQYGTDWAAVMAFITLAMLPPVIFYLLAERHLIAGLTAGAVKG